MHGNWNNDMHDGFGWGWIPMTIISPMHRAIR